jgi:nucleoid DNA-binding protein
MEELNGKHDFIEEVARRAKFTQGDVRIILNVIIDIFEEAVRDRKGIFVYGLGRLYFQTIPERKGSKLFGERMIPESIRPMFRLSKKLRSLHKEDTK